MSNYPPHSHDEKGMPTGEYTAWYSMKQRCLNPDTLDYKDYGGQGIVVWDKWLHSFENFFAHMGKKPSPEMFLDLIDKAYGYEPGNCRWATRK